MAGNPVGTMYVELSLDATKYTKAQKEIIAGAEKNSADINKVFKTVGTQSDAMYDAMRKNIQNSLNAIKQSHISSADEIRRAQESAAAKIKSIHDQQYGHQVSTIDKLKAHWIGATVAIGAAWMAVSQAMTYMEQGAKALQVESSFKIMADAAGVNSERMISAMKAATKETIDDSDMMLKAVKLMTLGFNPDQIERFSKVVITASQIAGTTATEAYERLADAIANRMPKALVQMGAVTKEQMKVVNAAIEGGADSVVLYELAMANLELKQKMLKGTQDQATVSVQRFQAQVNQTKEDVGKGIIVVLQTLYGVFQWISAGALSLVGYFYKLAQGYNNFIAAVSFGKTSEFFKKVADSYKRDAETAFAASQDLTGKAMQNITRQGEAGDKATKQEIQNAKDKVNAQLDGLKKYAAGKKEIDKEAEAEERRKQAAHELSVDLWIKDEARKWELLEQWEKEEAERADKIAKERERFDKFSREQSLSIMPDTDAAAQDIMNSETDKFAYIQDLQERGVISFIEAEEAKKQATERRIKEERELASDKWMEENRDRQDAARGLSDMFAVAASLYEKDSKERRALSELSKAATVAEIALQVQKNLMIAVGAVVQQGTGDPYTAFARIAAMIAVVTGVLSIAGIAFSGGGGSSHSSGPVFGQNTTVLGGANGEGSQSITKAWELLEDTYKMEYHELRGIYNEMKDLNANITGLVNNLIRGGGNFDAARFNLSMVPILSKFETNWTRMIGFFAMDPLKMITGKNFLDPLGGLLTKWLGGLGNSIMGGEVTFKLLASGLAHGAQSVAAMMAGGDMNWQEYAQIQKKTDGGWFKKDKKKIYYQYQDVNEETSFLLNSVFENISSVMVELATGLGGDMEKTLAYVFKAGKINLAGKDAAGINTALTEYFSAIGDTATRDLFGPIVAGYQEVGEGLMQTAIRLMVDKAVVLDVLEMTNQAYAGTTIEAIAFSESMINLAGDLEKLSDAAESYFDKFFTDPEKLARLGSQLGTAFTDMDMILPSTRGAYRTTLESLDLMTESGKEAYVQMLMLSEAADKYYQGLEDAQQKLIDAQQGVVDEFQGYVDKLKAARESMRMEGIAYARQQTASAQLAFDVVLAQARTGDLSGIGSVDKSMSALIQNANSPASFATLTDYQSNFYRTYNAIAELEGLAGNQLSIEEQTLDVLKEQLAIMKGETYTPSTRSGLNSQLPTAIKGYADGGDFSGGWRIVGENGPELEYTGPSTIMGSKKSASMLDNSDVVREVRALREDLKAIGYPLVKNTGKVARINDRWDVDGIPAERTLT